MRDSHAGIDNLFMTGFDLFEGTLYCSGCSDVIYHPQFQEVLLREKGKSLNSNGRSSTASNTTHSTNGERNGEGSPICRVPRGMYNLGASCFMNVILQSFVQNPLLRNYFLSDRHHAALCPARENCLACELDKLFTEVRLEKGEGEFHTDL
jgi:ubiquitin carboxyl-terminal hydrolase 22/27/51